MYDYIQGKKGVCTWSWRAAAGRRVVCPDGTKGKIQMLASVQTKYGKLQEQSMLSMYFQ